MKMFSIFAKKKRRRRNFSRLSTEWLTHLAIFPLLHFTAVSRYMRPGEHPQSKSTLPKSASWKVTRCLSATSYSCGWGAPLGISKKLPFLDQFCESIDRPNVLRDRPIYYTNTSYLYQLNPLAKWNALPKSHWEWKPFLEMEKAHAYFWPHILQPLNNSWSFLSFLPALNFCPFRWQGEQPEGAPVQ